MSFFHVVNKTIVLLIFGLVIATTATAKDTRYLFKCPPVDKIHQAAPLIDKAQCSSNECDVFTEHSVFFNDSLYWMIGLMQYETSSSSEEVIREAQNIAANVSVMFSDIAVRFFNSHLCVYVVTSDYSPDDEYIKFIVAVGSPDKKAQISLSNDLLRKII